MLMGLALAGCKGEPADRCEAAVRHMLSPVPLPAGSEPGKEEQRIIDAVAKLSVDSCRKEGLTKEQADCILRVRTMDQLMALGECPAIKARRPSWLKLADRELFEELQRVPPPTEEELEELTREPPAPADAGR